MVERRPASWARIYEARSKAREGGNVRQGQPGPYNVNEHCSACEGTGRDFGQHSVDPEEPMADCRACYGTGLRKVQVERSRELRERRDG